MRLRALLVVAAVGVVGCDEGPNRAPRAPRSGVAVTGRFTTSTTVLGTTPVGIALGRCNDDEALDFVVFGAEPAGLGPSMGPGPRTATYLGAADGRYELHPDAMAPSENSGAAVFADVDGDGREDLVVADDRVRVARNLGSCRFAPAREVAPAASRFARSIVATDVDLDGVTDLCVATRGPVDVPFRVLLGRGDGTYEPLALTLPALDGQDAWLPFATFWDDLDGDGHRDLLALVDRGASWLAWGRGGGAHALDVEFSTRMAGSDPMAVAPLDHDADGVMDYFVSGIDHRSLLLRGGTRRFTDDAYDAWVEGLHPSFAWSAWAFDADLDGRRDLLVERLGSEDDGAPAAPVELYLARGDGTYAEQGSALELPTLRGKSMACGDLRGDGRAGCLLMTDRGLVVLQNEIGPRGRWAHLRLRGTVSEPNAEGARVVVPALRAEAIYYGAQISYGVAHDRGLVVAIGDGDAGDVEIRWPSGLRQRVRARAGAVTEVVEPAVVSLSARVGLADGRSEVVITLAPGLVGATTATLTLEGAGVLARASATEWRLTAPTTEGVSIVTVALDGTPLRVRPRVWWRAGGGA